MSWPARTWVAGEKVTAALGNGHWRDPVTDLRGGGVAIASQAANDFLFASSASQWGRVAAVSGRAPNYTGAAWDMTNTVGSAAWPVGSVYESVLATNPGTLMGFGTWGAFGTGRVTVCIDAGQTEFDTVEETGGSKTHTLTSGEIPSHNHIQDAHNHTQNSHNHTQNAHDHTAANCANTSQVAAASPSTSVANDSGTKTSNGTVATNIAATATNIAATATNQNAGSGAAHQNIQPYVVIYRWKRTA